MASEFDKNLNISYVDKDLPVPSNKLILKHCICSYIVYFLIYIFLCNNPFFKEYFIEEIRKYYLIAYSCYLIFAPLIYFVFRPKTLHKSHNIEVCNYFKRVFSQIFSKDTLIKRDYKSIYECFKPSYLEKQSLMLTFIKVFFGTLMIKFLINNINSVTEILNSNKYLLDDFKVYFGFQYTKDIILDNRIVFYNLALSIFFMVDVLFFTFGYLTECFIFKNKIRTVDTSLAGIFFCLMCYPPFNIASTKFAGWNQNDQPVDLGGGLGTFIWIIQIAALLFLFIYTAASVALGTKASNLTNRGTVSRFPYNIIRHPAYLAKSSFWILTTIPVVITMFQNNSGNIWNFIFTLLLIVITSTFWVFIYYMRAITEERHLMQDPEYQEYAKRVRWRFIPYVI